MSRAPSDAEQARKLEEALKEKPSGVQPPELLGFPAAKAGVPSLTRPSSPEEVVIPETPKGVKAEFLDDESQAEPEKPKDILMELLRAVRDLPQNIRAALED